MLVMLPDVTTAMMLFALSWGLLVLVAYLTLPQFLANVLAEKESAFVLGLLVSIALFVRLVPDVVLPMGAGYDIESYELVADSVLSGRDVYTNPDTMARHPYLPFQMYWMALARWLSVVTHTHFVKVVRLAPILADTAIAVSLFAYFRRMSSPHRALECGLLYALNPISVFVSAYHGQFDAIPLLFLTLTVTSFSLSRPLSSIWLGLGVLSKSWPILGLPALWWHLKSWRERLISPLIVAVVPVLAVALYSIAFHSSVKSVLQTAMGYNWGVGVWGYTYLLRLAGMILPSASSSASLVMGWGRYITLGLLAVSWLLFARRQPLPSQVLTIFVTFFAVTHAFSVQYLVWLVPLAVLEQDRRWLTRYTLAATAYMLLVYTTLVLAFEITRLMPWPKADWFIIIPSGLATWCVTLGWAIVRWKSQ